MLYSSLTVAGALASLLVFPLRFLYSMGIGGMVVALSAGAVALIVLPAVLVALGPRINSLAPAWLQRSAARSARCERGGRLVSARRGRDAPSRHRRAGHRRGPARDRLAGAASAAGPGRRARAAGLLAEPPDRGRRSTKEFASNGAQTITHRRARIAARSRADVDALALRARQTAAGQATEVAPPRYLGRDTWEIELLPRGSDGLGRQPAAGQASARARSAGGTPRWWAAATAWFIDQKAAISAQLPLALAILVCVTLGTLFLMTGSVVLPLMALLMNLLTVAVGAGLLVLIFQDGHLSSLIGLQPDRRPRGVQPRAVVHVAFALSTDYGVFLFARIKEVHDGGVPTREAVAQGLERTGRADHRRRAVVLRRGRRVRDLAHLLHQGVRHRHRAGGRDRRDVRARAARAGADGQAR